tara:strand:- start:146 stop:778 length:633 start_codon:yes stop_codon:yes gene_type:complete
VHNFEANKAVYEAGAQVIRSLWDERSPFPGALKALVRNNMAVSNQSGSMVLWSNGDDSFLGGGVGLEISGQNDGNKGKQLGTVQVITLDEYLEQRGVVKPILYAKIDAEGVDVDVMLGASQTISSGQLRMFQLEHSSELMKRIHEILDLGFHAFLMGTKNLIRIERGWTSFTRVDQGLFANILFLRATDPPYTELLTRFNVNRELWPCWV